MIAKGKAIKIKSKMSSDKMFLWCASLPTLPETAKIRPETMQCIPSNAQKD